MTDNVHVLGGGERPNQNGEPNPKVVAYCEKLLEMAQSGKLQWIASAQLADDGFFASSWVETRDGQMLQGLGAISLLHHEFAAEASMGSGG